MRRFALRCRQVIMVLSLAPSLAFAADAPPPAADAAGVPPPVPQPLAPLIDGEPPEAEKTTPGHKPVEIAAVPYPTADPALGVGVTLMAVVAIRRSPQDTRPITIAGGAMWADSGSWGAGGGVRAPIMDDRVRLVGGGGGSHIEYDFFGIGEDAGETGESVPMISDGGGGMLGAMFRTWPDFYVGPRVLAGGMRTRLDTDASGVPPELQGMSLEASDHGYGLGLQGEWDTRDSTFYPTSGWYVKGDVNWMMLEHGMEVPGQDDRVDYGRVNFAANRYWSPWTRGVLAMRASTAWRGDDTPFYQLAAFGNNNDLRGYESGRYRDHTLAAVQAEYRHELNFWRLAATGFAGVGRVAPDYAELFEDVGGNLLPAAGVGLRWTAATQNHINLRLDSAWGRDGFTWYLGVGEAF